MSPKKKRLTTKQAHFVKEHVVNRKGGAKAVVDAGYAVTHAKSAEVIAYKMLGQPKIQNAIQEELDRIYPDSRRTRFHVLHEILEDSRARPGDRMKAVEILNKMVGDNAATRHERAEVKVSLPKLPGARE